MKHTILLLLLLASVEVAAQNFVENTAVIEGKIPENHRQMVQTRNISEITASYDDILTGIRRTFKTRLSDNLAFSLEVPLILENQSVKLSFSNKFEFNLLAKGGDTTFVEIDLPNAPDYQYAMFPNYEYATFSGANADVNTALSSKFFNDFMQPIYYFDWGKNSKIKNFAQDAEFFKTRVETTNALLTNYFAEIDKSNFTPRTKEYLKTELKAHAVYYLSCLLRNTRKFYIICSSTPRYSKKIDMSRFRLDMNEETLSFLSTFDFFNTEIASTSKFFDCFEILTSEFSNNYPNEKNISAEDFFAGHKAYSPLLTSQECCRNFRYDKHLTQNDLDRLPSMSDRFYYNHATSINSELQTTNGNVKHYFIDADIDRGKVVWEKITGACKGKITVVDFWYTQCGACLYAQREMAKIKPYLLSKGVEFVYITAEGISPKDDYYKYAADFDGLSFYLTRDQFMALQSKFHAHAFPLYMILDKDGNIKFSKAGYKGNDYFKEQVEKVLSH